jgi:hypothetical protein
MGQGKQRSSMPGVAEGKKLVGVPTDRTMSPIEKANHFVAGAMSGEYTVCICICCSITCLLDLDR